MGMRRLLAAALVGTLLLAGCFGATTEPVDPAEEPAPADDAPRRSQPLPSPPTVVPSPTSGPSAGNGTTPAPAPPAERFDVAIASGGELTVEVPVPVVLFGFPVEVADALAAALGPRVVDHDAYNNPSVLNRAGVTSTGLPITTRADYRVYRADDAAHAQLVELVRGAAKGEGGLVDANLVEDFLAARVAPDASAPALVLLAMPEELSYRYTLPGGALEGVRVFGERHPLLVVDVTARTDPWVGSTKPYDEPLDVSAPESLDALVALVAEATHHRLLQGPLYPPATAPCHAVTVLVLERATSLSTLGLLGKGAQMLDVEGVRAGFEGLMGNPVHLDVSVLVLPADDPALAVLTTGGESDALRAYLDMNFESYHVAHDGCEPYLSVLVDGDATDSTHGIAEYDAHQGRRISFSFVDDVHQICFEQDLPISCYSGNDGSFDWFTFLVSHETGHLLGQRHPHDITGGDVDRTRSFSSIWSPMSYQVGDAIWEFGAIDRNNQLRNRVGYLLAERHADLAAEALAEVEDALSVHDWARAERALRGA